MAAPNIKSPSTINTVNGKTVRYAVTTTMGAALSNAAASNKLLKVYSAYCCNIDGTNSADITFTHFDGTTDVPIQSTLTVPVDATQLLVTRDAPINLEEGQSLRAQASANGDLVIVISYDDIS